MARTSLPLKIDRSFVSGLRGTEGEAPIIEAIVALAAALELEVIGEGVDHPAQARAPRDGLPVRPGYVLGHARSA